MPTLQEIALKTSGADARIVSGHRMCSGCGIGSLIKTVLAASDKPVIVISATGCLEVVTTIYPFTAWNTPWMHLTFENAASVAAGVESAYKSLKRRGRIDSDVNILAVGGDGGTYDIGFQALSGALERQHKFMYLVYDNEGYMNTGNQRSGATPFGASTTTVPAGKVSSGKPQWRKNLVEIVAALTMQYSKLAVETNFWPLYEIENGVVHVNTKPSNRKPIEEFLKGQTRFRHLFKSGNEHVIVEMQKMIDDEWARLLKLEESGIQF